MDKFQFRLMEEILKDPSQKLTITQYESYASYLMPKTGRTQTGKDFEDMPPSILQKILFHKIAQSGFNRSGVVNEFMYKMESRRW